jgi:predicted ATPase
MIESIRIKNFKAVKDSGNLKPQDFCVFIGNNGSGKSSVLEALRTLQDAYIRGIEPALNEWGGIEQVRHHSARLAKPETTKAGFRRSFKPIEISLVCKIEKEKYYYDVHFNTTENGDRYVIEYESLKVGKIEFYGFQASEPSGRGIVKYIPGHGTIVNDKVVPTSSVAKAQTAIDYIVQPLAAIRMPFRSTQLLRFAGFMYGWQFMSLNAHEMGLPMIQNRTQEFIKLDWQGRNIAEVFRELYDNPDFRDIVTQKMKYVLPYVSDIQSNVKIGFQRTVELHIKEEKTKESVPGWLFSSGTLRILAMLTVFNNPNPPTLIMIDEIENGLDPRTISLLLDEVKIALYARNIQVIATSHSPYFLDLLELRHIIVTERTEKGVEFSRPDSDEGLNIWKEKFSPGKMYTMNLLTKNS